MSYEIFWEYQDSDYNDGILLENYNGEFSLVSAAKSQKSEGTVWMKWGFPQNKKKEPIEKAIPWKVRLGNHYQAIKALEFFLGQLKNEVGQAEQIPEGQEDIPF